MNSQDPEINTSNTSLNNVLFFDNFDYVPNDYDVKDIKSMNMTTESLVSESVITETHALTKVDKNENIILLKNIDIDTKTDSNETL
ncbi:8640_t:CDS:2, partial [Ambispora gerdemannii]